MPMATTFEEVEPDRAEVDAYAAPTLLEFGAPWCGFCKAAQPLIAAAMTAHPTLRHLKIEDGSGRPLGRSFRVKLWPTLIAIRDGQEVARVVRPQSDSAVQEVLAALA